MTVEDCFPVGMRVLAVDDDPTCLKLLEKLLRQCDYHVTTTSQAIKALNLLRENKDKFDLVISDVHMPDMDGFKLLELVSLEMDLPVIMLSANSDTKAVMKGITHGACDYLLKPVRIEELKNIWQHVIRRRKVDSKDQNNAGHGDGDEKLHNGGQSPAANEKLAKKRKDQNEEDDDDCDENDHSNGDSSTQKKSMVVWPVELHRKFVAAVNQLGIDRAVPERILDLMNVEKLSRENVASHLQKYRLYLKRISQHENIAAAFGGKDLSYLHMGSLDRLGDFHAAVLDQIPKTTLSSFQGSGALSRLNSATGLALCGLNSSGMIELGRTHNSSNLINDLGKLQHPPLIRNQNWNLLQGMPHSLDIDQLQQNKHVSLIGELSSSFNGSRGFPSGSQQLTSVVGSPDSRLGSGSCSTSYLNVTDNHSSLQGHQHQIICGGFGNQSSIGMAALNTEPFDIRGEVSSQLPEHGKSNDPWQSDASIFGHSTSPLSMGAPFSHNGLLSGRDSEGQHSLAGISLPRAMGEREENSRFSSFGNMGNTVGLNNNYAPKESGDHRLDFAHNPNVIMNSSMDPLFPNDVIVGTRIQSLSQSNGVASTKTDATLIGQPISVSPFYMQHSDESVTDSSMKVKEDYLIGHAKLQRGFNPGNCSPFDELMTAILKPVHEEVASMDGGGGFNCLSCVNMCVKLWSWLAS